MKKSKFPIGTRVGIKTAETFYRNNKIIVGRQGIVCRHTPGIYGKIKIGVQFPVVKFDHRDFPHLDPEDELFRESGWVFKDNDLILLK